MRYGLSISVKRVIPSCPPLTNFKITREAGRREERKWCLPQGGMERSAFHRVSAELEEGTSLLPLDTPTRWQALAKKAETRK